MNYAQIRDFMSTIGLTGGIGAGKDEVAAVFKKLGATVIDADKTGHKLLGDDPSVRRKILAAFGRDILGRGGKIDRKKLGGIVFSGKSGLRLLNNIMHPQMEKIFRAEISRHKKAGKKIIVLNAAVLFEAGWDKLVDRTILVSAPRAIRIKRLEKKGIGGKQAAAIISSQWPDAAKKKKADFVIKNDAGLDRLSRETEKVCKLINA